MEEIDDRTKTARRNTLNILARAKVSGIGDEKMRVDKRG